MGQMLKLAIPTPKKLPP